MATIGQVKETVRGIVGEVTKQQGVVTEITKKLSKIGLAEAQKAAVKNADAMQNVLAQASNREAAGVVNGMYTIGIEQRDALGTLISTEKTLERSLGSATLAIRQANRYLDGSL